MAEAQTIESLNQEQDEKAKDLNEVFGEVNMGDFISNGLSVRVGGKLLKFEFAAEDELPEEEIRKEYAQKATEKLQEVREILNARVSDLNMVIEKKKSHYEKLEQDLRDKLAEANLMPEITIEHAIKGLSVVKGRRGPSRRPDTFTWLYQGIYWPKTCNGKIIDPAFSKKMISPVTIEIITERGKVIEVVARQPIGLNKFNHYHSTGSTSDCWGDWNFSAMRATTPDEILEIGRKACSVLENINTHSPGTENPSGLPRMSTIENHILDDKTLEKEKMKVSRADKRIGIVPQEDAVRREDQRGTWSI